MPAEQDAVPRHEAGEDADDHGQPEAVRSASKVNRIKRRMTPGARFRAVLKRTLLGTWEDGTIHAGNLAYLAILSIFPFFILGAAIFSAVGEQSERAATINTILLALPPVVGEVIGPVARDVISARTGWFLWVGGAVGLWTVSGLVETIRDILRRAYRTRPRLAFWRYRLLSFGVIIGAICLLIISLIAQVLIGAAQEVIATYSPWLSDVLTELSISRIIPAIGLYVSIYLLFYTLSPAAYRHHRYPKWPGTLLVTLWWVAVTAALPPLLRSFFAYDMTYGSLAGIMVTMFFFWLVGLGMVLGAELNAALAATGEAGGAEQGQNGEQPQSVTENDTQ
ncbi:YihY/virulence factor BrkB family protein [Allopontixanthobacter sp.]|uniref:YihY/virulence factor BrkB family protein n=1 Tax=Allopontixanthobacter sp. TaxID=2906452 RepID=UPI002ABCE623|nr:YihY/virulence factor BrkB family protein [Allopontixanthobacter sp.]MDZ4308039.1 YihY/virulence factor BrkB family protein [Allopontixanthobacter sp.]